LIRINKLNLEIIKEKIYMNSGWSAHNKVHKINLNYQNRIVLFNKILSPRPFPLILKVKWSKVKWLKIKWLINNKLNKKIINSLWKRKIIKNKTWLTLLMTKNLKRWKLNVKKLKKMRNCFNSIQIFKIKLEYLHFSSKGRMLFLCYYK
jgi:hypothetical protein